MEHFDNSNSSPAETAGETIEVMALEQAPEQRPPFIVGRNDYGDIVVELQPDLSSAPEPSDILTLSGEPAPL